MSADRQLSLDAKLSLDAAAESSPQSYFLRVDAIREEIESANTLEKVEMLFAKYPNYPRNMILPLMNYLSKKITNLEIMKHIATYLKLTREEVKYDNNCLLRAVCEHKHVKIADWLYNTFELTPFDLYDDNGAGFKNACSCGDLDMIKWMISIDRKHNKFFHEALILSLYRDNDDMFIYLVDIPEIKISLIRKAIIQVFNIMCDKNITRAKDIADKYNITDNEARVPDHASFTTICEKYDPEALSWFVDRFHYRLSDIAKNNYRLFTAACCSGTVENIQWIVNHFNIQKRVILSRKNDALFIICKHSNLPLLQWMISNFDITQSEFIGDQNGQLILALNKPEIIKWVLQKYDIAQHKKVNDIVKYSYDIGNIKLFSMLINYLHLTKKDIKKLGIKNFDARLVEATLIEIAIEPVLSMGRAYGTSDEQCENALLNCAENFAARDPDIHMDGCAAPATTESTHMDKCGTECTCDTLFSQKNARILIDTLKLNGRITTLPAKNEIEARAILKYIFE